MSHPDNLGKYLDLQSDIEHQLLHWHSLSTSVQTYTRKCNISWYIHGMSEPFPQVISVSTLQTIVLSLVELSQETSVLLYFLIGKLFISQQWASWMAHCQGAGSPSTYAQEMPFLTPGSFSPEMDNTILVQDHPSILIRKDLGVQHPDYISEGKSTVVHPGGSTSKTTSAESIFLSLFLIYSCAAGPTAKMTVSMGVGGAFLGSLGSFREQGQSLPWCECGSRAGILRPLCRLLACPSWHIHGPSSQSQSGSGGLGWCRPAGPLSLPVKPKPQKVSLRRSEKGANHAKERKESFLESKSLVTPNFLHQV